MKKLNAIFMASACLSGCAPYYFEESRPNIYPALLKVNAESQQYAEEVHRYQALHNNVTPEPNDLVVDYPSAPPNLKEACTKYIHQPLSPMPTSYPGSSSVSVVYDITSSGRPVNPRIDSRGGNPTLKSYSINDVLNSTFYPPVFEGRKLFCTNVRDGFHWMQVGLWDTMSMRNRHNMTVTNRNP